MTNFRLDGKIALVTGASYGIGYAIAKGLAEAGAKIIFNDINEELVAKGMEAYKADGIDATGYVCDVTDEDAVNAMVKDIEETVSLPSSDIIEQMLIILPPPFLIIDGITALEQINGATRSTSTTCLNSEACISHIGILLIMPALLTKISITPTSFSICETADKTAFSSVTSKT